MTNPTLNLIDWRSCAGSPRFSEDDHFKIESMKNTIDYQAGQFLKSLTVQDLITMGWNINIRQTKESDFK
jgi:hypothetical protein